MKSKLDKRELETLARVKVREKCPKCNGTGYLNLHEFDGPLAQCDDHPFTAHQRKAGQSKSPKKLKALAKARKLAAKANRSENPSPSALYQRKRRARLKREKSA